jgi:hypothetical protein
VRGLRSKREGGEKEMNLQEIKEQVKKVIEYSQGIPNVDVDWLIDKWYESKKFFIENFGDKCIYEIEQPIQFHLSESERKKRLDEFISLLKYTYELTDLVDFINANIEGFYTNSVCEDYIYKDKKIPKGMKLVRAFKYFEEEKILLDDIQTRASRIIQEDKVEGILCLSVHPLDFLSSSMNTYSWRSCHALDGEYRAGNLSYMVDESTIICYVRGANDCHLPLFPDDVPWNSKKWRVLIHLSDNKQMVVAGRQYPFVSNCGLDLLHEHLKKLFFGFLSEWHNDYVSNMTLKNGRVKSLRTKYIPYRDRLEAWDKIILPAPDSLNYNDLLYSSLYTEPYYAFKERDWWSWLQEEDESVPTFTIGGAIPCLCCKDTLIKNSEFMVCNDCADELNLYSDDYYVCDCCGNRIYDNDWYEVEGEILCDNCYCTETFECEECNTVCFNDERHYECGRYLCNDCYGRY